MKKSPDGTKTYYSGSFIYEEKAAVSSLKYILHSEGKYQFSGATGQYQYDIKDHLGNVRLVVDGSGTELQQSAYYPFGMQYMAGGNADSKYLYNGKELQDDAIGGGNLDWYDYGARMYDPALGRWHVVDPMAEKYESWSVYQYVRNNPILRIDPNGMDDYKINRESGAMELVKKTDDETDRVVKTYSRKSKRGEVKYKKNGEAKTAFGGVEKGILSDGINFQEDDNIVEVGGEGQPSVDGVKSFTLQLSEHIGKEVKGFSYSPNASGDVTDMLLTKYKDNSNMRSFGDPRELIRKYGVNNTLNSIVQQFHTHPDGKLGATASNPHLSQDVKRLQVEKPQMPNASFIILYRITGQVKPGEYPYTHEYRPKK